MVHDQMIRDQTYPMEKVRKKYSSSSGPRPIVHIEKILKFATNRTLWFNKIFLDQLVCDQMVFCDQSYLWPIGHFERHSHSHSHSSDTFQLPLTQLRHLGHTSGISKKPQHPRTHNGKPGPLTHCRRLKLPQPLCNHLGHTSATSDILQATLKNRKPN
jgi:hypothetical protein